ncbi:MAG: hypothetical protein ACKVVP_18240 [Chloroflexota bacterium]
MEARLWSVLISLIYGAILYLWQGVLGDATLDGAIGIVLGLYTCSHPAAYFLNLLFFERGAVADDPNIPTGWPWAGFNVVVMIIGWLVVVAGAMQMATSTA